MTKRILLLAFACTALQAQIKQSPTLINSGFDPIQTAMSFYQTTEWQKAFAGNYGVNPGVEPGIPEGEAERATLGQIRPFLQSGTDADLLQAVNLIEALFSTKQAAGEAPSPMMLQIAGALNMRLGEVQKAGAEKERYLKRAETYFKRAVDPNTGFPNFLRAHKNLANLLFRQERQKEALPSFIKAIELGDRDAVTFGLLGAIYLDEGKLISSESALRNSLMINPKILEFKQLLGNVLLQQERYNEAKEIFDELLQRKPNEVNFWMAQSNCYIALEMIDEASTNLEILRFMGKANAPSLMLLGDVYINREMIDEATAAYIDAINAEPTTSNLNNFFRAAETLTNFASYRNAMLVLDHIKEVYGENLPEDKIVDMLTLSSEINISLGEGEAASENLEALLERDPFNARALLTLARYFGELDAPDGTEEGEAKRLEARFQQRAILYYERAQDIEDDKTRLRAYTGEAQLRVRRDELAKAVNLLEEAQSIEYSENVQAYLNQIKQALRGRSRT